MQALYRTLEVRAKEVHQMDLRVFVGEVERLQTPSIRWNNIFRKLHDGIRLNDLSKKYEYLNSLWWLFFLTAFGQVTASSAPRAALIQVIQDCIVRILEPKFVPNVWNHLQENFEVLREARSKSPEMADVSDTQLWNTALSIFIVDQLTGKPQIIKKPNLPEQIISRPRLVEKKLQDYQIQAHLESCMLINYFIKQPKSFADRFERQLNGILKELKELSAADEKGVEISIAPPPPPPPPPPLPPLPLPPPPEPSYPIQRSEFGFPIAPPGFKRPNIKLSSAVEFPTGQIGTFSRFHPRQRIYYLSRPRLRTRHYP